MKRYESVEIRVHETQTGEQVSDFINANKIEKENMFNKTCRICLEPGNIPIFGNEASPDMSADIKYFGDVLINIDDLYPKFICEACSKLLEAAVMFRKTAKQSDEYLRSKENHENIEGPENETLEILDYLKTEVSTDSEYNGAFENSINIKDEFTAETSVIKYNNTDAEDNLLQEMIHISLESSNQEPNAPEPFDNLNEYYCKTCDLNFESSKEYSDHRKTTQHKKARYSNKIECNVCYKEISRAYYNRHLELHSNESKDDKLQCPICNKSYSKTYFNYHITHSHNKEQKKVQSDRIECSICNKSYEKQYYKFHLAIHDNASSKYVCDMCGKSFIQQSAFKRHRLVHGTELAYKCTLCPYRGRHPGLVKTHMQTHTRDYQHRCMECPARFLTKSNLNKHLQRHKGPVNFKCETCKRGFYSKLELERHFEADHLGVKNHVCNICEKAFGYRNAMMSHQLKVHKREKLTNGKGRLPLYLEAERKNESSVIEN